MHPETLLAGCLRGESAAQTAFYRHFAPDLLGVCLRYAHSRTDAQDILQEAFIRIFERLDQYQGSGTLAGWLKRVVVTTAINHYHAELRYWQRTVELTEATHITADGNDMLSQLSAADLLGLISQLPTGYRVVLNLYCIEGFSHKEIAQQLGIEERTSSSQLHKARRLLQALVRRSELIIGL
ncbi:MAG: sigma-70 family RNA polymerase sigma factor [Hymenobacteraceae bacterium]|nr:sigma-70 family RNA polymerase sigma factor [Hymenobacteraceae bacterium]